MRSSVDVVLELVVEIFRGARDGAVADEEVRRAVDAHLLGECLGLLDLRLDLRRGHVLLQLFHVEAELRRRSPARWPRSSAPSPRACALCMSQYLPCLPAAMATREASSEPFDRIGSSLKTTRTLGSLLDQLDDVVQAALAVAAVVIEELDDGDVAVGLPASVGVRRRDRFPRAFSAMATFSFSACSFSILASSAVCTSRKISGLATR